jgi:hypothetical protein
MVVIRRPDHRNRWRTRIVVGNVRNAFIFLVTSYFPLCAIFKLAATRILHLGLGWWVWGYFFSISLMTLVVYGGDKQSSEMGGWRSQGIFTLWNFWAAGWPLLSPNFGSGTKPRK